MRVSSGVPVSRSHSSNCQPFAGCPPLGCSAESCTIVRLQVKLTFSLFLFLPIYPSGLTSFTNLGDGLSHARARRVHSLSRVFRRCFLAPVSTAVAEQGQHLRGEELQLTSHPSQQALRRPCHRRACRPYCQPRRSERACPRRVWRFQLWSELYLRVAEG